MSANSTGEKRAGSPIQADESSKRVKVDTPETPTAVKTEEPEQQPQSATSNRGSNSNRRGRGRRAGGGAKDPAKQNRRDWVNDRQTAREAEEGGSKEQQGEKKERLPKKKVALLVGYEGTGMQGSQINPGVTTVEGVLFDALIKAKCISEDNAVDHAKVQLGRAARTDAGVHALINCLVIKLIMSPPGMTAPTIEEHINAHLPSTMRVWKVIRVQASFNPRTTCDGRRYEYSFPSYCLLPPRPGTALGESASSKGGLKFWTQDKSIEAKDAKSDAPDAAQTVPADAFWQTFKLPDIHARGTEKHEDEMALRRSFRLAKADPQLLTELREASQQFVGNHNFHNYTTEKAFTDRSAMRQIKSIDISDPFLVSDETEWISVVIHGQSFMLHQIRKMMGLLIMLCRLRSPASLIPETYGPQKIHIPKAPALGLMLRGPIYDMYNKKVGDTNKQVDARKMDENARKEAITYEPIEDQVQAFKKVVMEDMWAQEAKIDGYTKFLVLLDGFPGNDFAYFNSTGTIPKEAVFINGKLPAPATANPSTASAAGAAAEGSKAGVAPEFDDGEAEEALAPGAKNEDG